MLDEKLEEPRSKAEGARYRLPLLLLGFYLLSGSVYSFWSGKWFPGFPPLLDFFGALPHGPLIEAIVSALLGAIAVITALIKRAQPRT
jgi:hypothetical protein